MTRCLWAVASARYAETGFWFNTALGGLGNAEFTSRFPGIREALLSLPCKSAIIDAEVMARREDGSPDFRALHSGNYSQEDLCVWCFGLLELSGEDGRSLPVIARKQSSRRSSADTIIAISATRKPSTTPSSSSSKCRQRGLEGIASKKKHTPYKSRKCDWLKMKCTQLEGREQGSG